MYWYGSEGVRRANGIGSVMCHRLVSASQKEPARIMIENTQCRGDCVQRETTPIGVNRRPSIIPDFGRNRSWRPLSKRQRTPLVVLPADVAEWRRRALAKRRRKSRLP